MPKFVDLTGKSFGRLTVLSRAGFIGCARAWTCRCICGSERRVVSSSLLTGHSKQCHSCGAKQGGAKRVEATAAGLSKYPGLTGMRRDHLWKRYRLRPDDYLQLFCKQLGRCAITGDTLPSLWFNFVDHNHRTGKVRGLLLPEINTGLGFFRDCPALLRCGAEYLERHETVMGAA
jgi:hypothetical protein